MNARNDLSRITIDIPKDSHRRLKATSAILGKSMREIVLESIEKYLNEKRIPNKETIKVIRDAEKGKGLLKAKNLDDLRKKLGI